MFKKNLQKFVKGTVFGFGLLYSILISSYQWIFYCVFVITKYCQTFVLLCFIFCLSVNNFTTPLILLPFRIWIQNIKILLQRGLFISLFIKKGHRKLRFESGRCIKSGGICRRTQRRMAQWFATRFG